MTEKELVAGFLKMEPLLCVEYRSSKAETIHWRDKVTHAAMAAPTLRHTVEFAGGSMAVMERVDDTFKVEAYKSPFVKGQRCALRIASWQVSRGAITASGILEPVTGAA